MSFFDEYEKYGNHKAAIDAKGNSITYKELKEYANEMNQKIVNRCLVFSLCRNEIGSLAGYMSFLSNQIVPLLLDANINDGLFDNLCNIYRPAYIYLPEEMVSTTRFVNYEEVIRAYDYVLLKTNDTVQYTLNKELGLLLTTSGSTGSSKLVRQSYVNIQENARSIAEYLELDETERPVTTLPMNYTYGLSIINSHMLVGATILMTRDAVVSKTFWDFMKAERATSIAGVPYTYEILKKIRFFSMKLPELRYFTQAGGKLSPELHKEFAEYARDNGKKFIVMYGQTEATARMAYLPAERSLEKYGSMGIAIPRGRLFLVDVDGREIIESDIVGELVFEGPNVTLGYAETGNDLIKGDERHGRLATGDMATQDKDGFFYIVGRKKRFLKLFGNRVNLDEIDQMVKKEYPNLDCASTGTDEIMSIYITDPKYVANVTKMISERTHINRSGIIVKYIEKIPRNEAGKVLYKDL